MGERSKELLRPVVKTPVAPAPVNELAVNQDDNEIEKNRQIRSDFVTALAEAESELANLRESERQAKEKVAEKLKTIFSGRLARPPLAGNKLTGQYYYAIFRPSNIK